MNHYIMDPLATSSLQTKGDIPEKTVLLQAIAEGRFEAIFEQLVRLYAPVCHARFKRQPADFQVAERLGFGLDGQGEHLWLRVRKTHLNTAEVAQVLAKRASCRLREIGFSGLKDKQAVTEQWFSLPIQAWKDDREIALGEGAFSILEQRAHGKKLRRGSHLANDFSLILREVVGDRDAVEARLAEISALGVPNYFGMQRFGRGGKNLSRADSWLSGGQRPAKAAQSIVLSAARSWLFNVQVAQRIGTGRWDAILPGEIMMLAGSRSFFEADAEDAALITRLAQGDIHHSALLPGVGMTGKLAANESEVMAINPWIDWVRALEQHGVKAARRAVRLIPQNLAWEWVQDDALRLTFSLPKGAFATALLRELGKIRA